MTTDIALDQNLRTVDAVEKTLLISFFGAILSLLVLGGLAYHATTQHARTLERTLRIQETLTSLADLRSVLSKAESRNRAYLVTGDRNFLAGRGEVQAQWASIRQKLNEITSEGEHAERTVPPAMIEDADRRIARRSELLKDMIALHDTQPGNAQAIAAIIAEGNREMASIESLTHGIERRLADAQTRDARHADFEEQQMITFFGAMAVVTVVFLAVTFWQVCVEVRQRKSIQQRLFERERNLQEILGAAVDGIIVIDAQGIVQSMNPAAEHIFGYESEEVVGHNVSMLMPEPYHSMHDGYLDHYLRTGEKRIIGIGREVLGKRKDGSVFPMDLAVGESHSGRERRFIGTVRDVSARKQAEQEQEKLMADLSAANEELRSFSYVVSHDLKAPLRAIGSLATWLMEDYGGKLGEEGNRQMELLIGRVQRMDLLIDGILEYSRAGRPGERPAMIDSGEVLKSAIDMVDVPPNMAIKVETPMPRVPIDPVRLQQVFQNLIGNAVKHANVPGGEIRIGCAETGECWQFHVCDNGPGIDPRNFDRIFQLFQTLVPKDTAENTGVGLAIVKKIAESYGGKAWVESETGTGGSGGKGGKDTRGTCFYVSLPKRQPSNFRQMEHME